MMFSVGYLLACLLISIGRARRPAQDHFAYSFRALPAQFAACGVRMRWSGMRPKYIVFMRARLRNPTLLFVVNYIQKYGRACFSYAQFFLMATPLQSRIA
jgi:hypothetical protein